MLDVPGLRDGLLPELVERAETLANLMAPAVASRASQQMNAVLGREITRLTELQRVNPNVRPEEVAALVRQQAALAQSLAGARLRLDAVRLIRRGPG